MNLYFLLEGKRTERALYGAWLEGFRSGYRRIPTADAITGGTDGSRRYFLFSANGYPSIVRNHLPNAVEDVIRYPGYDWLVVCLDVDESTVENRVAEVAAAAHAAGLSESPVRLQVIPQMRCIESWLLGNVRMISTSPPPYLSDLRDFYDVRSRCPERMGHPRNYAQHADFHLHYLKEVFKAKGLQYTKSSPGAAATTEYFEELRKRYVSAGGHLESFGRLVDFLETNCS